MFENGSIITAEIDLFGLPPALPDNNNDLISDSFYSSVNHR